MVNGAEAFKLRGGGYEWRHLRRVPALEFSTRMVQSGLLRIPNITNTIKQVSLLERLSPLVSTAKDSKGFEP